MIKQKHRIQTKTKIAILYCFRIWPRKQLSYCFLCHPKNQGFALDSFVLHLPRAKLQRGWALGNDFAVTKKHFSFPEYLLSAWGGKEGLRCFGKGMGGGWNIQLSKYHVTFSERLSLISFFFFFFQYLLIHLDAPGLSCSRWDIRSSLPVESVVVGSSS